MNKISVTEKKTKGKSAGKLIVFEFSGSDKGAKAALKLLGELIKKLDDELAEPETEKC